MTLPDGIKRNVIDAHSHIGEIQPWPFYGHRPPREADGLRLPAHQGLPQVHGPVQDRAQPRDVELRRSRSPSSPSRSTRSCMEAATTTDRIRGLLWVSFLPRNRELTLKALEALRRGGHRRPEDDLPARRQPRTRRSGTRRPRSSPTSASTRARSTTTSSTSTRRPAATSTSTTSSRWSRSTASAARSTSSTSAAASAATSSSCRSSCSG